MLPALQLDKKSAFCSYGLFTYYKSKTNCFRKEKATFFVIKSLRKTLKNKLNLGGRQKHEKRKIKLKIKSSNRVSQIKQKVNKQQQTQKIKLKIKKFKKGFSNNIKKKLMKNKIKLSRCLENTKK